MGRSMIIFLAGLQDIPEPFYEAAAIDGAGRWANDRVWLYDFSEALGPGTRCTLKARSDWKPSSGALTALVLTTLPTATAQVAYMALFGLGSTVGMAALSGLIGWPLARWAAHEGVWGTWHGATRSCAAS